MKPQRIFLMLLVVFLFVAAAAESTAADFDWIKDFNIKAEADLSGFRARLAARFRIGDVEIDAVLGNVEKPAEAYMVFRLGKMSEKPAGEVLEKYKFQKSKGWGALAKSLGIKPGSKEFHALKQGDDLYVDAKKAKTKNKSKAKSKN